MHPNSCDTSDNPATQQEQSTPRGKGTDVTDQTRSPEGQHHHRRRRKSMAPKKAEEEEVADARPQTPWQMFEGHVKSIGDDTTNYSVTKNEAKFKSSNVFQKVVDEINAKKQMQELKRLEKLRQLQLEAAEKAAAERVSESESESESETDEDDEDLLDGEPEDTVSLAVKLRAQRGWALIKRKIQEKQMEKKNSGAMFNWKVLKATMSNMSDMEKARQDLYERYLYKNDEFMGEMKLKDKDVVFGITIHKKDRPSRTKPSFGKGKRNNRVVSATSSKRSEIHSKKQNILA